MKGTVSIDPDFGVFRTDALDELDAFFRAHGFCHSARPLFARRPRHDVGRECAEAQARVANGELANKHGNSILTDAAAGRRFANYVQYITQIAPTTRAAVLHPAIVGHDGALDSRRAPARAFALWRGLSGCARRILASGYKRIGWHS
jgi:hypothetical protein